MKKKLLVISTSILSLGLVATIIPISVAHAINSPESIGEMFNAFDPGTTIDFSADINATKPGRGETVSFLPESVSKFWQMEDLVTTYPSKAHDIGELTPYSDELSSWAAHAGSSESDKEYRRAIFEKYDAFRPTNNVLAWNSNVNAKNYRVIISQQKDFSTIEREYTVSGSTNSVVFENPYTGVDYYWQVIATKNDDSKVYSDIFNFTSAALPRTIHLEGVSNTRDLGGNVGLNSKKTKQGLLYRGMGLEAITTNGENEFKNQLGIKTELDLRNNGEGTENYLGLSNYYHYPSPIHYNPNPNNDAWAINWFGEGSLVTSFGNAIKVLANKDNYPVYFHCSVGRDRTGLMGLFINFLCGVSEEVALKDFHLSLFSVSGAYNKGAVDFYNRYINIRDYLNTYNGANLSEKAEDYLVTKAGVTHEECENIRKIFLGDIDTGFVPGSINPDPYTDFAKVTFRKYGESPIIKMVEVGSLIDEPNISGNGQWYHGNDLWDFEHDVVEGDMYLDYLSKDKCQVMVRYTGLDLPDEIFEVDYHTQLDFSRFNKDGYTFKVYDEVYNRLQALLVEDDVTLNVVYSPVNGYIPKANSRVIILAGQSNAAGVGHFEYLENSVDAAKINEITNGYDNVLMSGYTHGKYMNTFSKVYADKDSQSAGTPGTFGFEVGLADRLSKVFPDETTYIIKSAYGGASLNYDYISPTGASKVDVLMPYDASKERGWLYKILEETTENGLRMISETTNTIPMIEAFMWMQGESDATLEMTNNYYIQSFQDLLDDYTSKFQDSLSYKFTVYDGLIAEGTIWKTAKQMNEAKRAWALANDGVIIDTVSRLTTLFEPFGLYTDNAHYDAACYIDLGHMFADAYLERTIKGYTHDAIEIEAPEKITLRMGQNYDYYVSHAPRVLFNGEEITTAKMTYFAEQHKGFNDTVYSYFTVNDDNSFTPTQVAELGETKLRITAYYHDEVRTVLVPVEVLAS